MGKASRGKRDRQPAASVTHEPAVARNWPEGHVKVQLTGMDEDECIVVTIHDVRHYLHSTTAHALNQSLTEHLQDWDTYAKSQGASGILDTPRGDRGEDRSQVFDAGQVADELEQARIASKEMVRGALRAVGEDRGCTLDHLPLLGFVERAQAFHKGVLEMVEHGNPLAAATLLRSFAENLAVAFYVEKNPHEFEKLRPGAEQGLPMGKVVAAAQQSLPGFKDLYDHLSSMAHPSGAGAFQTLRVEDDGQFFWQSSPTFRSVDDARHMLGWLEEIRGLSAHVIENTAAALRKSRQH